ncbi:MAG: hypothetical protein Q8L87_03030 [Anaerolineales bacterium]|jgi:hypothetical protein|nr:hypothetical protein [Anaerolineales bacterium]
MFEDIELNAIQEENAHADRAAVRALYTRLTKDGVDAWFDKTKLIYN